jgi:TonB-dependent receptor
VRLRLLLGLVLAAVGVTSLEARAAVPVQPSAGPGSVVGRVFDGEAGSPLQGVTVILMWPASEDGTRPKQEVRVTDAEGSFAFGAVPAGVYSLRFVKAGYRASVMTDFEVQPGQPNRADFPLPPLPVETSDQILELEPFVVEASTVDDIMDALELRMDSDELLNIMSAEDLSKYAASDVADALKRVAGVNVVGGQFAVIRGLEDRYNSTLYNHGVVPSPDPDRQSVQLDLFPSDVVSNLVVAKTFGPNLPSNSSGGSIDIVTHDYPEKLDLKLSLGSGFNDNATDRFLEFVDESATGEEADSSDTIERDLGALIGGRRQLAGREFRFKGVVSQEIDYETRDGYQEAREPRRVETFRNMAGGPVTRSGDLSLGELSLTDGRFDLTESERAEQITGYLGLGLDLDGEGNHSIDASAFYTRKQEETVQLKEDGHLPGLDYAALAAEQAAGGEISRNDLLGANPGSRGVATLGSWLASVRAVADDSPLLGPLVFSSFFEGKTFDKERDLLVYQINGDHWVDLVEGLHISWAANHAKTTQDEGSWGARVFFEPCGYSTVTALRCPAGTTRARVPGGFPVSADTLGPGQFATSSGILFSSNDIDEAQSFARMDVEYETPILEWLTVKADLGTWYERASRDVASTFLEQPGFTQSTCAHCLTGGARFAVLDDTLPDLGESIFADLNRAPDGDFSGARHASNDSKREIKAWSLGAKATLWEKLDLLGGVRLEDIFIESRNDPFTGQNAFDGTPAIFPTKYLFLDRLDNPARRETSRVPAPGTVFNDQILGIDVPADPATGFVDLADRAAIQAAVNGEIDETKLLPAFGLAYRPIEGLSLRGAYSQTVARPSFREMGYYISVEPGSDDLIIGNPQLVLSDVESLDARVEYVWGDRGDLVALSAFSKTIDDPIESLIVRNPANAEDSSSALFRTFFNNPDEASLKGIEFESRKSLGFLGPEFTRYLSVGGNYTYIDAEVDRTDAELARSRAFFGTAPGDPGRFSGLKDSRRLFGQPEWIANADISFSHPDWGTKITLAFFAISDVLDAAGSANINNNGEVVSFTLDRYIDSFNQLDLTLSQSWRGWTLKASIKNLTDTTRRVIYDPEQTAGTITERSFEVGRDFSLSLSRSW